MNDGFLVVGPSKLFMSGISYYTIRLANALSVNNGVSAVCMRKMLPRFLFPGKNRVGRQISALDFLPDVEVFDELDYNDPRSWSKACSFIREKKPSTIILQWWTCSIAHMFMMLVKAGKKSNSKILLEMHEVTDPIENRNFLLRIYSRLAGKMLFPYVDGFVTHSESDKVEVSSAYGIDKSTITTIPLAPFDHYGNDWTQKQAKKELGLDGEFVILSFGLVRTYKGIPYLIEAFNRLPKVVAENSNLLIVGEVWDDRETLLSSIHESKYSDRIRLVDEYVPDEEVPVYFSASDVICLPYLRASQSAVAHIGITFGKPMIVSSVGGLKESMSCYEGTSFVPPADADAIADEIAGQFKRWAQESRTVFRLPDWDWQKAAKSYESILSA